MILSGHFKVSKNNSDSYVTVHPTCVEMYTNANLTDEAAEKYLAKYPDNIKYFSKKPDDWEERVKSRKDWNLIQSLFQILIF